MHKPTEEEFKIRLSREAPEWELIGKYTNALTRTEFKHKPCGHTYLKTPYNVTSKPHMCRFCNANRMRGEELFLERAKEKVDYEVLGEYKNNRTKILVRHKKCGKEFETTPYNFCKTKEGCPFCVGKTISESSTWTHERFLKAVGDRVEEYEFLSEYINAHTPIKVRHCCGNEFEITPDSFLRGGRCKACKYSTGEGQVYRFLKKVLPGEVVMQGDRKHLPNRSEIDIYLPNRKLAIEYDGLAYHTEEHFLKDKRRGWTPRQAQNRQKWKTDECYKQDLRMVHIFEDEWLEHRDIVEDKLKAILKTPATKYYARKLTVKEVPKKDARDFLEANHIQGGTQMSVSVGLYDGDKLLAVQSFCKYTRKNIPGAWELVRYATLLGTQIVGGFSRCLKWFERNYSPKEVISFADLRWCDRDENVYLANGFEPTGEVEKKYWYVKPPKRFHKSDFRKRKFKSQYPEIYSPDKTEAEMAKELGLQRIYDCGLIRYHKLY